MVAIAGIDTRRLTRILRDKGAQAGCIVAGEDIDEDEALAQARAFPGLTGMDLAREVTTGASYAWSEGVYDLDRRPSPPPRPRFKVVAYDFGIKRNILRLLAERGCAVTVVPAQTPVEDVLAMQPDGVFLSNGPGDPAACDYAVDAARTLLDRKIPLFGICLGHQIMALAVGAKTLKMKFGHHGANHPVKDLDDGRVLITSQNHGFAVDPDTLPAGARVTHQSLFDGSLQGFALDRPPGVLLPGASGGQPRAARHRLPVRPFRQDDAGREGAGPGTRDPGPGSWRFRMTPTHFRDLDVWQVSMSLAKAVYVLTADMPSERALWLDFPAATRGRLRSIEHCRRECTGISDAIMCGFCPSLRALWRKSRPSFC